MSETKERCFVMMPFSDVDDYPKDHFTKVYEQIIAPAIKDAGYEPYRVDENKISDSIIEKIFDGIQNCEMALCDLSSRNPNVLYELGLRQAYDKPVVLIQDNVTDRIFDVSGISTVPYNRERLYEHVLDAQKRISEAIKATRDGKGNSVVKIVQARSAEISRDEISRDDKIEILLRGIMADLANIKDSQRMVSYPIKNTETRLSNNLAEIIRDGLLQIENEIGIRNDLGFSHDMKDVEFLLEELERMKIMIDELNYSSKSKNTYYHQIANLRKQVLSLTTKGN